VPGATTSPDTRTYGYGFLGTPIWLDGRRFDGAPGPFCVPYAFFGRRRGASRDPKGERKTRGGHGYISLFFVICGWVYPPSGRLAYNIEARRRASSRCSPTWAGTFRDQTGGGGLCRGISHFMSNWR